MNKIVQRDKTTANERKCSKIEKKENRKRQRQKIDKKLWE